MQPQRLPGDAQVPVRFTVEICGKEREIIGYTYENLVEELLKPETLPLKRLLLCLTAYDNRSGEVIKNRYGYTHKDLKP